jgi:hypothetical protein
MKAKALFIMMTLHLVLFSSIAYSQYYQDYSDSDTSDSYYVGDEDDPPDWYEVSEEEVIFCQNYAGQKTGFDGYETAEGTSTQSVSKLTMSLQAESTAQYETTLYEVAWYVHPLAEDLAYTIYLVDEEGDDEEFYTGSATALDGSAGYETLDSEIIYVEVKIVLEDGSEALRVPIVEKEE